MIADPVVVEADVGDADEAAWTSVFAGGAVPQDSKSSVSFHMGTRKTMWRAWPMYSWVIWSSMAWLVFCERGEQRRRGLADLEIDGAVLDLDDDVVRRTCRRGRLEIVVGGAGAIVFRIVPVHVVVVDEAAIEDQAAVRLEGAGDDVGGIGVGAAIGAKDRRGLRNRLS